MTPLRQITGWLLAVVVTSAASVAFACSPAPSADWDGWLDDRNDIFAGRVVSLTPLPRSTEHGIELQRATIRIQRLRSFENRLGPASIDADIVLEVFNPTAGASALCLYPDGHRPGDTVLVIQSGEQPPRLFVKAWANGSRFAPLFEAQTSSQ